MPRKKAEANASAFLRGWWLVTGGWWLVTGDW